MPFNFPWRKRQQPQFPPVLYYKSNADFFASQCEFGYTEIQQDVAIVGLVLDAKAEFGVPTSISIGPDGSQLAAVRIASHCATGRSA